MSKVMEALEAAASGLTYPSETDAPLTGVSLPSVELTAAAVEEATRSKGSKKRRAVKEQSVDEFFQELEDADDAAGFKKLKVVVEKTLAEAKVFRIGGPKVDVYLLGQEGEALVGLHTVSVET